DVSASDPLGNCHGDDLAAGFRDVEPGRAKAPEIAALGSSGGNFGRLLLRPKPRAVACRRSGGGGDVRDGWLADPPPARLAADSSVLPARFEAGRVGHATRLGEGYCGQGLIQRRNVSLPSRTVEGGLDRSVQISSPDFGWLWSRLRPRERHRMEPLIPGL